MDVETLGGERVEVGRVGQWMGAGSYPFYCRFHQAEGMTGTIIVRS
jgi:plastocyanin